MTFAEASAAAGLPVPIRRVAESRSTNDDVAALAARGAAHGTALVADRQHAGRGRLGREWEAGEGNLALSVLLRPRIPLARVPLVCLAASVVVAEVAGERYRIKWPNDVLAPDGRKVAGILAELEAPRGRLAHLVLGVGVNLVSAPPLPAAAALSEDGRTRHRARFAARLVRGVLDAVVQLEVDPAPVLDAWRSRAHTLGRCVRVGDVEGVAVDIDPDGALRVRTTAGEQRVLAGDVQMVGRAGQPDAVGERDAG